jgi:hypothetical protein
MSSQINGFFGALKPDITKEEFDKRLEALLAKGVTFNSEITSLEELEAFESKEILAIGSARYNWTDIDTGSSSVEQAMQKQSKALDAALSQYSDSLDTLKAWGFFINARDIEGSELIVNDQQKYILNNVVSFYQTEKSFNTRINQAIQGQTLSEDVKKELIRLTDQLDNARKSHEESVRGGFHNVLFGTPGYATQLELEKTKFLIENVVLKGGTAEDVKRYEKTFNDEIEFNNKALEAKNAGKTELANFYDLLSGRARDLRVEFLDRLFVREHDPDEDQTRVKQSAAFFENNYNTLMGRVKNEMFAALEKGATLASLKETKVSSKRAYTMREEFDTIVSNLKEHAVNNRSIKQIMAENSQRVIDFDRDGSYTNKEVADVILDSQKALASYAMSRMLTDDIVKFDIDNDGDIDGTDINYLETTMAARNSMYSAIENATKLVDANGDSSVNAAEMTDAFVKFKEALKTGDKTLDLNNDNRIDYTDFTALMSVLAKDNDITNLATDFAHNVNEVMLAGVQATQKRLTNSIEVKNESLDDFYKSAGEGWDVRGKYYYDYAYANWATAVEQTNENWDTYGAWLMVNNGDKFLQGEKADMYMERRQSLDAMLQKVNDGIMGSRDYWGDIRYEWYAQYKDRYATDWMLLRGSSVEDVKEMDRAWDAYIEADADAYSYYYGMNLKVGDLTANNSLDGQNVDHKVNMDVVGLASQVCNLSGSLVYYKYVNINKVDPEFDKLYQTKFDDMMKVYDEIKDDLIKSGGLLTLESPEIKKKIDNLYNNYDFIYGLVNADNKTLKTINSIDGNHDKSLTATEMSKALADFRNDYGLSDSKFDLDGDGKVTYKDYDLLDSVTGYKENSQFSAVANRLSSFDTSIEQYQRYISTLNPKTSQALIDKTNNTINFQKAEKDFDVLILQGLAKGSDLPDGVKVGGFSFNAAYSRINALREEISTGLIKGIDVKAKTEELKKLETVATVLTTPEKLDIYQRLEKLQLPPSVNILELMTRRDDPITADDVKALEGLQSNNVDLTEKALNLVLQYGVNNTQMTLIGKLNRLGVANELANTIINGNVSVEKMEALDSFIQKNPSLFGQNDNMDQAFKTYLFGQILDLDNDGKNTDYLGAEIIGQAYQSLGKEKAVYVEQLANLLNLEVKMTAASAKGHLSKELEERFEDMHGTLFGKDGDFVKMVTSNANIKTTFTSLSMLMQNVLDSGSLSNKVKEHSFRRLTVAFENLVANKDSNPDVFIDWFTGTLDKLIPANRNDTELFGKALKDLIQESIKSLISSLEQRRSILLLSNTEDGDVANEINSIQQTIGELEQRLS